MHLDTDQVASYLEDGLLVVPGPAWLDSHEIQALIDEVDAIQVWPEQLGRHMMYWDELPIGKRLNRIENFFPYAEYLQGLFASNRLGRAVQQLAGEPVCLFKDKINFKQPGGEGFLPHQDAQAGWDRYGHTRHISVAIAIDRSTEENGCLEFVRSMHTKGLLGPLGEQLPSNEVKAWTWVPILAASGDVIFFDSYTPHRSGPNRSARQRRLAYLTYNLVAEGDFRRRYYEDKRLSFPPNLERRVGTHYTYNI